MAKKKTIDIEIKDTGEVVLETSGFKGPVCLEESQFVKDLLGEEVSRSLVPAYRQKAKKTVKRYTPLCG